MKRCWQAILVIFFLFALACYSALAQEVHGPKMVIKEKLFDFNTVKEGEVLEHTFLVFNEGDQTLEIKNVKPG
jgi:hypothetical protein